MSVKEVRPKRVHGIWLHWYKLEKQAKLTYADNIQESDYPEGGGNDYKGA